MEGYKILSISYIVLNHVKYIKKYLQNIKKIKMYTKRKP